MLAKAVRPREAEHDAEYDAEYDAEHDAKHDAEFITSRLRMT